MTPESFLDTIDEGRDPERAAIRQALLRESAHGFYRASAPWFHSRLAQLAAEVPASPLAWCAGDLHLENAAAYRASNGLAYFDLVDLDHAALAPVAWELMRLATSIRLAARAAALAPRLDDALVHAALAEYAGRVTDGHLGWLERDLARGEPGRLVRSLADRRRKDALRGRLVRSGDGVQLRHDRGQALEPSMADRTMLEEWFATFREASADRREWELVDIARRVTGLASLGRPRWVLLIRSPKLRLYDLKACPTSSLAGASATLQPGWADEGTRVVNLTRRLVVQPPAALAATRVGEHEAVFREAVPNDDRLTVSRLGDVRAWQRAVSAVAALAAWAHLRGAGRQGADRPDALGWWGREVAALEQVSRLSRRMADEYLDLWHQFKARP